MSNELADHAARERFRLEWDCNFAVSANAGSGKTTAISERLAAIALSADGPQRLRKTAVVTYTKKAAAQIGQRARQVLLRRLREEGISDLAPLDHLERAFFGTIHSFCLKLAQTYGQTIGINLNPTVVTDNDEALWEEFLEEDPMQFAALPPAALTAFLRHVALEEIFPLARELDATTAAKLLAAAPVAPMPAPPSAPLEQLLAIVPKGNGKPNIITSQERARAWEKAWREGAGFLPLYEPAGASKGVVECAHEWMAPLKRWLADVAAALAGELAQRYRVWRFARGVQTYADQIDAAMAVLRDESLLDRIRREGWRIVLDEAQDTDPQQFAVLVEITRPPGAVRGTWPAGDGAGVEGPRPGHFCMVGDGQQAIYGSRADIGNFSRHLAAFRAGNGGELLDFQVTFRAPHAVIQLLNTTLPAAFGQDRAHNFGVAPAEGATEPFLQVPFVTLEPGPKNVPGIAVAVNLRPPAPFPRAVHGWLAEEARQVAQWLRDVGLTGIGAKGWGEVAILAPRNEWLVVARREFERLDFKVALQTRNTRCRDNPAYAWLTGLLAVCVDPENMFEWNGVLREVFGVSDALLAAELRRVGRFAWEEPGEHPAPLASALAALRPFVLRTNDSGEPLENFVRSLAAVTGLAEKALRVDPSGSVAGELDRLIATAAAAGLEGSGPRALFRELLQGRDEGRPAGKPSADAINLLTSHSAKGLEWPVVIVLGLWRGIGQAPDRGLKLVRDATGARVYFDQASLPTNTRESRDRERIRELTRLLYVSLTRARRTLLLPFASDFGGRQRERPSFAELWGAKLETLATLDVGIPPPAQMDPNPADLAQRTEIEATHAESLRLAPPLPSRILPHQLAHQPDLTRAARHESDVDTPWPLSGKEEAIDYGLWWHETMEFLPWADRDDVVAQHGAHALETAARLGFGARASQEWTRLLASESWRLLRERRWTRLAELGVFAPLGAEGWIDGVIDFVLHDPATNELWIVDWKTNRQRPLESGSALVARLVAEYAPQLRAYGQCAAAFFPGAVARLLVYSTAAGEWGQISDP